MLLSFERLKENNVEKTGICKEKMHPNIPVGLKIGQINVIIFLAGNWSNLPIDLILSVRSFQMISREKQKRKKNV